MVHWVIRPQLVNEASGMSTCVECRVKPNVPEAVWLVILGYCTVHVPVCIEYVVL